MMNPMSQKEVKQLQNKSRAVEVGQAVNQIMDEELQPPSVELIQELYNVKIVHPSRIASKSGLEKACKQLWVKAIGYQEKIGKLKELLKHAGKQMDAYKEAVETANTKIQLVNERNQGLQEEVDAVANERFELRQKVKQLELEAEHSSKEINQLRNVASRG